MRFRLPLVLALCLPVFYACGGGGPSEPSETVTVFSDPSAAATPSEEVDPSAGVEPNVGDRALQIGQSRVGVYVTTTLLQVRDPYPAPDEYRVPQPGNRYVGLRVSQCLSDEYDPTTEGDAYSTYNTEFVAVTASGDEYPGSGSSYADFPLPKFPETATLNPGSCVKGWLTVELPEEVTYSKFVWRAEGQTTAEWLT